jgi:hypothetical protein
VEVRRVMPALMAVSPAESRLTDAILRSNNLDTWICGENIIPPRVSLPCANFGVSIALTFVE